MTRPWLSPNDRVTDTEERGDSLVILYHFTAHHLMEPILREGITLGCTPIIGTCPSSTLLIMGTQWLTSDDSFRQDWCREEERTLPYDRTEVRFTVKIDDKDERLFRYRDWRRQWKRKLLPNFDDSRFCDPSKWWIYEGGIQPSRILDTVFKDRKAA